MTDPKAATTSTPTEYFDYIAAPAGATVAAVIFIVVLALLLRRAVLHYIEYGERNLRADLVVAYGALVNLIVMLAARAFTPRPGSAWFEQAPMDGTQTLSAWVYAVLIVALVALLVSAALAVTWVGAPLIARTSAAAVRWWAARARVSRFEQPVALTNS